MAESQQILRGGDPIKPSLASGYWGLWVFAIFWNGIALAACFAAWDDMQRINSTEDYLLLMIVLFPLVGIFLIFQAVKNTVLYVSYGKSVLRLDPNPG